MKELKLYDDGGYDIEILDVYEEGNQLKVKTRCPYGEDTLGLSLKSKYLTREGIPAWRKQVKRALLNKYGRNIGKGQTDKKKIVKFDDFRGIMNIEDLDDSSKKPKKQK